MASRRTATLIVVGILAFVMELIVANGWTARDAPEPDAPADQVQEGRLPALAVAVLFPILVVLCVFLRLDGFSLGSIVIAGFVEAFLFFGWVRSPQHEGPWYFYGGTLLPFFLVVGTLAFHYLQKES